MIQQNLTYYVSSSTAVLTNTNNIIEKIFYNVNLQQTSSFFQSGSQYSSITQLALISESRNIAIFPYENTNLFIDSSSNLYNTSSNDNITLVYNININNMNLDPDYYFRIINSASLNEELNVGLLPGENIGVISLISSSIYNFELYGGNNKYNDIYVNDNTSSLYSISWSGSQKYTASLEPTSSTIYNITASVSNTLCCSPILLNVELHNIDQLKFTFETGSCGVCTDIIVYETINSLDYKYLISGSTTSPIYTLSGSYPSVPSLYYIIQKCGTFSSDQSNTLGLIPEQNLNF